LYSFFGLGVMTIIYYADALLCNLGKSSIGSLALAYFCHDVAI